MHWIVSSPCLIYQQGLEESTVWVDEMGNSYYEADNDHQSYVDGRNYAQEGDYYYDDSYQQGYDQNYYYDESQGAYVYYEDNSQYDYAYDSRSYGKQYNFYFYRRCLPQFKPFGPRVLPGS